MFRHRPRRLLGEGRRQDRRCGGNRIVPGGQAAYERGFRPLLVASPSPRNILARKQIGVNEASNVAANRLFSGTIRPLLGTNHIGATVYSSYTPRQIWSQRYRYRL
jgi:hypothetical protein